MVEIWGGLECTVNRVGDEYFDQTRRNGHQNRPDDIERFAALGIKAIRYPVIWERIAPTGLANADWSWNDLRLERLRELGVAPIAGLVHHGAGPRGATYDTPEFERGLAVYAEAVARRYPWIESYTPVNEPLTTARFSGLYGLWYPHGRDHNLFLRILLNEIRATRAAMRAIRKVTPTAKLIQTDDLGKVFSTPRLAYQAEFENERRWISYDLLTGRVTREHPLWAYLLGAGVTERELRDLADDPCPPDIIGMNHYLSSERFLDERVERYAPHQVGGNGRDTYADTEAARVVAEGCFGPEKLLREVWDRYHLPVAVTEVHNGATREEQLRWIAEIWEGALRLESEGVDIRAITIWSLLGSLDWNCLVTHCHGFYEPGAFDVRGPAPRPTAVAHATRQIATTGKLKHPVLDTPGWWHRPDRFYYPPVRCCPYTPHHWRPNERAAAPRRLLITGATGTLGRAFARACVERGLAYRLVRRPEMDIADRDSVAAMVAETEPWAIINTAGYVDVDRAESNDARCARENERGATILARRAAEAGIPLLTFSTDLVFDGAKSGPYTEEDRVAPLNAYGRSKARAEAAVLNAHPSTLVVRTSAFFGPWDRHNFAHHVLTRLESGLAVSAANDTTVSPTYVPDLVEAALDLLVDGEAGIWHLANAGAVTWADFARMLAREAGMKERLIRGVPSWGVGWIASRPRYSALASVRGAMMPGLQSAAKRYVEARPGTSMMEAVPLGLPYLEGAR